MDLEEITREAAFLPEAQRAWLAAHLLRGVDSLTYQVCDEEVLRRMREADDNPEVMITLEQLVSGLRPGTRRTS